MEMNRNTIIAIVLGIVAVGVVGWQLMGSFGGGAPPPPSTTATAAAAQQGAAAGGPEADLSFLETIPRELLEPTDKVYEPGLDPMRPVDEVYTTVIIRDSSLYNARIGGIVYLDDAPLALVNDDVLGVGEVTSDNLVTVLAIGPREVTLMQHTQMVTIDVETGEIVNQGQVEEGN